MTRRVLGVLCLALLAGCSTGHWTYDRPGLTPARLDQDLEACRKEAHRPYWFSLWRSDRVDRDVFNSCMTRKGYVARRDE